MAASIPRHLQCICFMFDLDSADIPLLKGGLDAVGQGFTSALELSAVCVGEMSPIRRKKHARTRIANLPPATA